VATGNGRVNISWTDNSETENGFRIERAPDVAGAPGTFATVGTTAANVTQFLDTGLTDGTKYYYRVTALSLAGPSAATATVSATTRTITNSGLDAQFWNDPAANIHNGEDGGTPALVRPDPTDPTTKPDPNIAVDWGTGSPDLSRVSGDNFSSQWDGTYTADYTGPTTFFTSTDDGGRLWLDLNGNGLFEWDPVAAGTLAPSQELIINSWVDQGPGLDGVNNGRGIVVNLVAGKTYAIRMRQFEHAGGAAAFLRIQTPLTGNAIVNVPTESLQAPGNTLKVVGAPLVDGTLPAAAVYTPKQHIVVQFNQKANPNVDSTAITITGTGGQVYGGPNNPGQLLWTYDAVSNSAIITFPGLPNEELPDGNYTLRLSESGVTTPSGNQLDGDANGVMGGDYVAQFYVLKGDTQVNYDGTPLRDRTINYVDYQITEANVGKDQAQRVSAADGDFNHDGFVNLADLTFVRKNLNRTLAAPAAPVASPVPTPVPSKPAPTTTTTKPAPKPTPKPAPKPAPKPVVVAKPAPKPVVAPAPKSVFATKRISSAKELLGSK